MDLFFFIKQWIWLKRVDSFPAPSNKGIQEQMKGVNLIIIKDIRPSDHKIRLRQADIRLDDPETLARFWELLQIDDSPLLGHVMCLPEYEFKFYVNRKRIATFGYLNSLIRYDKWNGDAVILESERLLDFLVSKGLRS